MINEKNGLLVLLNDVIETLKAIEVDGKKLFHKVGIYNSQFITLGNQNTYDDNDSKESNTNYGYPFKMPAAFVNAEVIAVNTRPDKTLEKEVRLSINFGLYKLNLDKDWTAPYVMYEHIHTALQQLKNEDDSSSALQLSGELPNTNYDNVYVYQLFYDAIVVDEVAKGDESYGTPDELDIDIEIENG